MIDCGSFQIYIRTDPSDRSEETVPIIRVHQGHEPRSFKRLFPSWEDNMWEVNDFFCLQKYNMENVV